MAWDLQSVVLLIVSGLVFAMYVHIAKVARDENAKRYRAQIRRGPPPARWQRMARWMAIWWGLLLMPTVALADSGYVTADPGNSKRVGLATVEGRYSVELGEGCDGIQPGVNVTVDGDELHLVDPIAGRHPTACILLVSQYMSVMPCAGPAAGECDVAYA